MTAREERRRRKDHDREDRRSHHRRGLTERRVHPARLVKTLGVKEHQKERQDQGQRIEVGRERRDTERRRNAGMETNPVGGEPSESDQRQIQRAEQGSKDIAVPMEHAPARPPDLESRARACQIRAQDAGSGLSSNTRTDWLPATAVWTGTSQVPIPSAMPAWSASLAASMTSQRAPRPRS